MQFAAILLVALAGEHEAKSMELLVDKKSAQDVFTEPQLVSLARAACDGDEAAIARALKAGADPDGKGIEDVTPLYWALGCHNLHGTEALLRAGANPNYRFGGRFSAVYAASTMPDPSMLKLLLKYDGDPDARDSKSNQSALERALSLGIHGAGWENYYALIEGGADINRADDMGETIATAAAAFGQFDKVAELLERGYSHDLTDLGRTLQARHVDLRVQVEWQLKVKATLERKGVHFPVPPNVPH